MKRALETIPLFLAAILFLVGCGDTSAPRDKAPSARDVAEDFLISTGPASSNAQLAGKAEPFSTPSFAKHVKQESRQWYQFKAWSITSQSMNSSQTEATVRGSVQATWSWIGTDSGGSAFKEPVGFRMGLVSEQGKWLVDRMEFGAAPVDKKE